MADLHAPFCLIGLIRIVFWLIFRSSSAPVPLDSLALVFSQTKLELIKGQLQVSAVVWARRRVCVCVSPSSRASTSQLQWTGGDSAALPMAIATEIGQWQLKLFVACLVRWLHVERANLGGAAHTARDIQL